MTLLLQSRAMLSRTACLVERLGRGVRAAQRHRNEFYADMWSEAAAAIGATAVDRGHGLIQVTRGESRSIVYRNYTDLDGPVTLRYAGNKPLVHEALQSANLPVPKHMTFTLGDLPRAAALLAVHGMCVVKPASGTGAGRGVTTGITTPRELKRAAIAAAGHGQQLLIEQQIAGHNVRLLFLEGTLLDAIWRSPPSVIGNGRQSIAALVGAANRQRLAAGYQVAQVILRYDADMHSTLARQQLHWRSVPAEGQTIALKTVVNDNAAHENVSVVEQLSADTIRCGKQAAAALGVRLAGVDIVIDQLDAPLSTNGVVLEVNTTPGLYIHYANQSSRVAEPILEACLQHGRVRAPEVESCR